MDPAWSALIFMLVAAALGWFWHDSLAARESANLAAQEACRRLGLQFLDGTVAFSRLRLTRAVGGHLALQRTYVFDYTANSIARRQGFVVLASRQVESVGFAPGDEVRQGSHQAQQVESQAAAEPPALARPLENAQNRPSAKVFSMDDWRRNRQRRPPAAPADDVDDARR